MISRDETGKKNRLTPVARPRPVKKAFKSLTAKDIANIIAGHCGAKVEVTTRKMV
jgi:hypothetical protein